MAERETSMKSMNGMTRTSTPSGHHPPTRAAVAEQKLLAVTFRIGPQQYGLPVSVVIEIVRLPALLSLAGSPPAIIGLLNLRGSYVPVLDGSILIGETPLYDLNSQIIIAGSLGENGTMVPFFGIRVDQVIDVRNLDLNQFTRLDSNVAAPFLQGVINDGEDSILMFHVDVLKAMVPDMRNAMPAPALEEEVV